LALCVLYTPSDHHFFETLRTHITPLLRQGAYHLVEEVAQAKVVALLVSPAMIADNLTYQLSERAANQPGCRLIPILVRAVGGMPPHLAPKRPLPFSGKVASGDAEWADVAAGLRQVADQMPVVMDRPALRRRLEQVRDSDLVASIRDNFPEVVAAIKAIAQSWDLNGRGRYRTLGDDMLDAVAQRVYERTFLDQSDPDGKPLADLDPSPPLHRHPLHRHRDGLDATKR
jgi:hypothetical protein